MKRRDNKYLTPPPFHAQRRRENHARPSRAEPGKDAMYSEGYLTEVSFYVTGLPVTDGNGLQAGSVFWHYSQSGEV